MQKEYEKLCQLAKEISLLRSAERLLEWDQETYMPSGGIGVRSEQKELLASLSHERQKSPEFGNLLDKLSETDTLEEPQKRVVEQLRRDYEHATKLPDSFVKQWAKTVSEASHVWAKAKNDDDFPLFAPHLEKIFALARERAGFLGYEDHPYNALLDEYEPEMTVKELDPLFSKLQPQITNLITHEPPPQTDFLFGNIDSREQLKFCEMLLNDMGIDFKKARLDRTPHPFCLSLNPDDVRLTTHGDSSHLMGNILAALHEGGHGLYEQGLPSEHFGTPLSEYVSLGIHESQSRFWETFIGLSRPFWTHYYPKLQKAFPEKLKSVGFDTFFGAINGVTPSFIRVHADQVTYCLHVFLRYEIEKGLLEGSLHVKDLPDIWNEKMTSYLGLQPKTSREGCLQDVHWSFGLIGYFPTYALGNIYAGEIFSVFETEFPDWETRVGNGHLHFIRDFLNEKVHRHGRQFSAKELIERIKGQPLSCDSYINHLENTQ